MKSIFYTHRRRKQIQAHICHRGNQPDEYPQDLGKFEPIDTNEEGLRAGYALETLESPIDSRFPAIHDIVGTAVNQKLSYNRQRLTSAGMDSEPSNRGQGFSEHNR